MALIRNMAASVVWAIGAVLIATGVCLLLTAAAWQGESPAT